MKIWRSNKTVKLLPALALTFGLLAPMPASASIVAGCIAYQCTYSFLYTGQVEPLTFPASATSEPKAPNPSEPESVNLALSDPAQSVVVPAQNTHTPRSSNYLLAGLIGLGVFTLIAGLVVARRGVPGVIAS